MSDMTELWRKTFATWPKNFRRKGVVVPVYGEAIPFSDFVMNESIVILERPTPDNTGARRVALPFGRIHTLKYIEPLKTEQFLKAGYAQEMSETLPPNSPPVQQAQLQPIATAAPPASPQQVAPQTVAPVPATLPTTAAVHSQPQPQQTIQQPVAPQPPQQHVAVQPVLPQPPAPASSQLPPQQTPAAAVQHSPPPVPQPVAVAPTIPAQPTPEQIQAAMMQRLQMEQQQMQQQMQPPPAPAQHPA